MTEKYKTFISPRKENIAELWIGNMQVYQKSKGFVYAYTDSDIARHGDYFESGERVTTLPYEMIYEGASIFFRLSENHTNDVEIYGGFSWTSWGNEYYIRINGQKHYFDGGDEDPSSLHYPIEIKRSTGEVTITLPDGQKFTTTDIKIYPKPLVTPGGGDSGGGSDDDDDEEFYDDDFEF